MWTKAWRMLRPDERPAGLAGRTVAYHCLCGLALRFAEGASVAAAALSASALLLASDSAALSAVGRQIELTQYPRYIEMAR